MLTVGAGDGEDGHQVSTLAVNNLPHLVTHAQLSKETYYHSKRDLMMEKDGGTTLMHAHE